MGRSYILLTTQESGDFSGIVVGETLDAKNAQRCLNTRSIAHREGTEFVSVVMA